MPKLRVFPDTGALVSMVVFPLDKRGNLALAGELLRLYEEGAFDLILGRVVVDELDEVIDRDFPELRSALVSFVTPFVDQLLGWPTPEQIRQVLPCVFDTDDAPIFATALMGCPDIVLSNDFETFHTSQSKALWEKHSIEVESLYGLLCVFGRRERKGSRGRRSI